MKYVCLDKVMISGGGAPEIEMSLLLVEYAKTFTGMESYCIRGYTEALEVMPHMLTANAGLSHIRIV